MTPAVLLILLLIGVIAPLSQSASLGSGDGVNPSGVEELEQSSTTGLSPSPSPMLVEKKRTLSGTFEMQRDLQLLILPESKYVHSVQLQEGGYSLASNGDPNQDTVFTIERYANTAGGTGPSHYYKMRRRGTYEYVYVNDNGHILIGEETATTEPAVFERIEYTEESFTFINIRQLNSDGSRTSCFIGFNSAFEGVCNNEQEKKYFLENIPHNNIG